MYPDAISSRLGDNLVSQLRFAFMTEIIVDQRIAVDNHGQRLFEHIQIFLDRLGTCICRLFLGRDFFGIHRLDEV